MQRGGFQKIMIIFAELQQLKGMAVYDKDSTTFSFPDS